MRRQMCSAVSYRPSCMAEVIARRKERCSRRTPPAAIRSYSASACAHRPISPHEIIAALRLAAAAAPVASPSSRTVASMTAASCFALRSLSHAYATARVGGVAADRVSGVAGAPRTCCAALGGAPVARLCVAPLARRAPLAWAADGPLLASMVAAALPLVSRTAAATGVT